MDSISSILNQSNRQEPDVIINIKRYVKKTFNSRVRVSVHPTSVVITTDSASLASALRMHITELSGLIDKNKKIVLRISG